MNARMQRLRAELRHDHEAFEQRVHELAGIDLSKAAAGEGDLARAALALHHAYGAVESLLARVARTVEGSLPDGADWHFLRHAYAVPLAREPLSTLQADATALVPMLANDLARLDEFLQALADEEA